MRGLISRHLGHKQSYDTAVPAKSPLEEAIGSWRAKADSHRDEGEDELADEYEARTDLMASIAGSAASARLGRPTPANDPAEFPTHDKSPHERRADELREIAARYCSAGAHDMAAEYEAQAFQLAERTAAALHIQCVAEYLPISKDNFR